jgi:hypothetical protein
LRIDIDVEIAKDGYSVVALLDLVEDPVGEIISNHRKDNITKPLFWDFLKFFENGKMGHYRWSFLGLLHDVCDLQRFILRDIKVGHLIAPDYLLNPSDQIFHKVLMQMKK